MFVNEKISVKSEDAEVVQRQGRKFLRETREIECGQLSLSTF